MDTRATILFELWKKDKLSPRQISLRISVDPDLQKELGVEKLSHERIRQILEEHPEYTPRDFSRAKKIKVEVHEDELNKKRAVIWWESIKLGLSIERISKIVSLSTEEIENILRTHIAEYPKQNPSDEDTTTLKENSLRKITPALIRKAVKLKSEGKTYKAIAEELNVDQREITKVIKENQ